MRDRLATEFRDYDESTTRLRDAFAYEDAGTLPGEHAERWSDAAYSAQRVAMYADRLAFAALRIAGELEEAIGE